MKKYEIELRNGDNADESSFVLWIQTDGKIETPNAIYCKEIEIEDNAPGIDVIIDIKKEGD